MWLARAIPAHAVPAWGWPGVSQAPYGNKGAVFAPCSSSASNPCRELGFIKPGAQSGTEAGTGGSGVSWLAPSQLGKGIQILRTSQVHLVFGEIHVGSPACCLSAFLLLNLGSSVAQATPRSH